MSNNPCLSGKIELTTPGFVNITGKIFVNKLKSVSIIFLKEL